MNKSKKTKIVYLLPRLFGGGAERLVVDLAVNLPINQYEVVIVCLKDTITPIWQDELARANISLVQLKKRIKLDPSLLWQLTGWLKEYQPDILHTHLFGGDFYGRLAGRLAKVPWIISTEHNINFSEGWLKRQFKKLTASLADYIISVSKTVASYAQQYEGVKASQSKVIYNGVPLDRFFVQDQQLPVSAENKIIIGSLGRLIKQKNWPTLIRAASHLPESVVIKIAGIGPQKKELLKLINQLNLQEKVKLVGWQSNTTRFLQELDIFVLPSWWEGLPVVLLEAGASNLPVVASAINSNQEVIKDQFNGLLFNPNDSLALAQQIQALIDQPQLAQELAQQLTKTVQKQFSFQQMLNNYQKFYEDLTSQ